MQDRLRNLARRNNRPYAEMLQLYGLERYLYRLSQTTQRFVLKGALMMRVWDGAPSRPTRDIDLLGPTGITAEEVEQLVRDCVAVDVAPDGVELEPESIRVTPIRIPKKQVGFRARFDGYLARSRLRFQIDIGTGDGVVPEPVLIDYPVLLEFPAPRLRAYTPYTTIAEKFEAIVKLDLANTRMKDYFDLAALAEGLELDGEILVSALARTFESRGIEIPEEPPPGLSDGFAWAAEKIVQWKAFLRKSLLEGRALPLDETVATIRDFLMPAVNAAAKRKPFTMTWSPGGPWRSRGTPGDT
ncbi:MAG: nucleotidyl transferase AbiEii/AbiGii toxin family protein [bacterium]|nr:nucleotidyl transferase AbiEii/AbiGii toxin family protein [bacterium]